MRRWYGVWGYSSNVTLRACFRKVNYLCVLTTDFPLRIETCVRLRLPRAQLCVDELVAILSALGFCSKYGKVTVSRLLLVHGLLRVSMIRGICCGYVLYVLYKCDSLFLAHRSARSLILKQDGTQAWCNSHIHVWYSVRPWHTVCMSCTAVNRLSPSQLIISSGVLRLVVPEYHKAPSDFLTVPSVRLSRTLYTSHRVVF